jgi:hypothetical protein
VVELLLASMRNSNTSTTKKKKKEKDWFGGEAEIMYTHVSKCKNDKEK